MRDEGLATIVDGLVAGRALLIAGNGQHAQLAGKVAARLTLLEAHVRTLTADVSTITAVANDYGFDQVYARQVRALGRPGDVLLILSTGAPHSSLKEAAAMAVRNGLHLVFADQSTDPETLAIAVQSRMRSMREFN